MKTVKLSMTTIHDVARHAGVSVVTVSRVLNRTAVVNNATRLRVEEAIAALGYIPSQAARSLRSRRSHSLALILPDITNAFWTTVARGVEDTAQREDYTVFLCNTDENPSKQASYLHAVHQRGVDGVIIAPYDVDANNLDVLRQRHTPTVVIDRRVEGWEVDCVRSDSIAGSRALVEHLVHLGHRRIAMISGPEKTSTAQERVAGYRLALEENGIPVDERLIRYGEFRARLGQALTEQLFEEGTNPTAIFAANNVIAMGALEALRQRGLTVPQNVALVCFDDLPDLVFLFPFLTVIAQPAYEMGAQSAALLMERIKSPTPLDARHLVLPSRLVLRYSCGRSLAQQSPPLNLALPATIPVESLLVEPLH